MRLVLRRRPATMLSDCLNLLPRGPFGLVTIHARTAAELEEGRVPAATAT